MSVARVFWPNAAQLARDFPPKWMAPNKKYLASLYAEVPEPQNLQPVMFARYQAKSLPRTVDRAAFSHTRLDVRLGIFDYVPVAPVDGLTDTNKWVDWHINFADFHLFGFYEGGLFAQDEMQVAEHPILGSIRDYLRNSPPTSQNGGIRALPFTRDDHGSATPCLIKNAERRVSVAVEPNKAEGRFFGLYGNNFRMASQQAIKSASRVLPRPTYSNIIAIEAPKYGRGEYTLSTINDVLLTAYTAFLAAKEESRSEFAADGAPAGEQLLCTVHTGHWGTGAFGGNKHLMAMLQILAARMAGVDKLVFHAFDDEAPVREAERVLDQEIIGSTEQAVSVSDILNRIEARKYQWGVSDGN